MIPVDDPPDRAVAIDEERHQDAMEGDVVPQGLVLLGG
jgi:hypothetical protein